MSKASMRQYQNNILITGTNGTLGNAFKQHYQKSHKVMGTSRSILDFNSGSNVDKFVSSLPEHVRFESVMLCAATYSFPNDYNWTWGKNAGSPWRQNNIADRPDKRREELNDVFDPVLYDFFMNNYKVNVISQFRFLFQLYPKIMDKIVIIGSTAGLMKYSQKSFTFEHFQYKLQKSSLMMGAKCLAKFFPNLKIIILCPGNYKSNINPDGTDNIYENVSSMCNLIDNFNIENSGKIFNFNGDELG